MFYLVGPVCNLGRRFTHIGRVLPRAWNRAGYARPRPVRALAAIRTLFGYRMHATNVRRNGREYQEQIQIIATAIGKPMPRAAAIVDANAKSKSSSGCTLSSSGMAYSTNRKAKEPSPGRSDKRLSGSRTMCSEAPGAKGCLNMVNKEL